MQNIAMWLLGLGIVSGLLGGTGKWRRNTFRKLEERLSAQEVPKNLIARTQHLAEISWAQEMQTHYNALVFQLCLWTSPILIVCGLLVILMNLLH